MASASKNITLTGITPLLMHAVKSMDPKFPAAREMKAITKKHASKKTDEDVEELARLEFVCGLYTGSDGQPVLPSDMIIAAIRDGGKAQKLGAEVSRSVFISEAEVPLIYNGPTTTAGLWDKGFYDVRTVKIGQARVTRCRPKFTNWSVNFTLDFDSLHIDEDQMLFCVRNAGARVGIGDYRPRFGRFEVTVND